MQRQRRRAPRLRLCATRVPREPCPLRRFSPASTSPHHLLSLPALPFPSSASPIPPPAISLPLGWKKKSVIRNQFSVSGREGGDHPRDTRLWRENSFCVKRASSHQGIPGLSQAVVCDVHHAVRTPSARYYALSCQATCCTQ